MPRRQSPLKQVGRPAARPPTDPEAARADGAIDRATMRDNPWDPLAANGSPGCLELASRKPSWPAIINRTHRPDIWMQAIRLTQKALVPRGPSTYGSLRSQGRRQRAITQPNLNEWLIHPPSPPPRGAFRGCILVAVMDTQSATTSPAGVIARLRGLL